MEPLHLEWDETKDAVNRSKHGVAFEAVTRLDWSRALIVPDRRNDYGEARWIAYAPIDGRIHALVFTRRGEIYRIISLRKANRREQAVYEAEIRGR